MFTRRESGSTLADSTRIVLLATCTLLLFALFALPAYAGKPPWEESVSEFELKHPAHGGNSYLGTLPGDLQRELMYMVNHEYYKARWLELLEVKTEPTPEDAHWDRGDHRLGDVAYELYDKTSSNDAEALLNGTKSWGETIASGCEGTPADWERYARKWLPLLAEATQLAELVPEFDPRVAPRGDLELRIKLEWLADELGPNWPEKILVNNK